MSTLLADLIEIPAQVNKGDFVMSLREGVSNPGATLGNYVVTDQLVLAYDNALGFVASAVNEPRSKAAYLDGSFGSGKSHFMAVLHLLLQRDPEARALPELAAVIAKHEAALGQRTFDLVPVHMIGAARCSPAAKLARECVVTLGRAVTTSMRPGWSARRSSVQPSAIALSGEARDAAWPD